MIHWLWYAALRFIAQFFFICVFRIRVTGRENIPSEGGVLLASNHQSFLDPVLIGLGLWREVHFMARDDLFKPPVFRQLIRSLNAFPVKKNTADTKAIREAVTRLKSGQMVVVFPEGTRNDSGTLAPLLPGAVFVGRKARCPIVPVAIQGANRAWPARYRIFHFSPVNFDTLYPYVIQDPSGYRYAASDCRTIRRRGKITKWWRCLI